MSRVRAIVVVASAACVAFAVAFACGPGSLGDLTGGRPDTGAPPADAPPDAPFDAGCGGQLRAVPPARPMIADDNTSYPDQAGVTFAFDDIRIDTGDFDASLPKPQGFDLDMTCTCPEPSSCAPPDAGSSVCDGPGGRDNSTGALIAGLAGVVPGLTPALLRKRIHDGAFTFLVHVVGWNGKADDPKLAADVRTSSGWYAPRDDAGMIILDDAGAPLRPAFDGTDVWNIDPSAIINPDDVPNKDCRTTPCVSIAADANAYVANGVLVAHFDRVPLTLVSDTGIFPVRYVDVILSGPITKTSLRGELAGRWPIDSVLAASAGIRDPITDASICPGSDGYRLFKETVCGAADITSNAALDGKNAPCDALSESLGFTSVLATAGPVRAAQTQMAGCPLTDAADSCLQ